VAAEVQGLIEHAKTELALQNYGGAAYLADQAERAAAAAQTRFASAEQSAPRAGEQPFTLPLHLQTTANANVREGPGTGFGVLFTLPAESPLLAYSSTEQWLRIADDAGRRGWIHQSLIRGRL
jgi:SH3-like domain-containing protein